MSHLVRKVRPSVLLTLAVGLGACLGLAACTENNVVEKIGGADGSTAAGGTQPGTDGGVGGGTGGNGSGGNGSGGNGSGGAGTGGNGSGGNGSGGAGSGGNGSGGAGTGGTQPGRYHPDGFSSSEVHGLELKTGAQDCRSCHGETLEGGTGPSCDSCHPEGWRTNCTFCHGGTDLQNGAPPRDLRGATDRASLSFQAHTEHLSERNHIAWDCDQCHIKPDGVLSGGHVFDATPGEAEVDFSHGLSAGGTYDGNGGCANLYCHGNGRTGGAYQHDAARPTCTTCHSPNRLGGEHREHVGRFGCEECHSATVSDSTTIADVTMHVNGTPDVAITAAGFTFQNGSCNGTCHGERHGGRHW